MYCISYQLAIADAITTMVSENSILVPTAVMAFVIVSIPGIQETNASTIKIY
jgi:hypothetical protein